MATPHEIRVQQPWFRFLQRGEKTVEGRLNKGTFAKVRVGDVLVVRNATVTTTARTGAVVLVVTDVKRYDSFQTYLSQEGLARTLPGIQSIADGVAVYRRFYPAEDEARHGVLALHVRRV